MDRGGNDYKQINYLSEIIIKSNLSSQTQEVEMKSEYEHKYSQQNLTLKAEHTWTLKTAL